MLTFLFWNLKQPRADLLASLARGRKADLVMLTEGPIPPGAILQALNRLSPGFFLTVPEFGRVQV
jgi:hypothetical protein